MKVQRFAILTLFVLAVTGLPVSNSKAGMDSIHPEKTIYPLFEVFEPYWLWGDSEVKVYGLKFNPRAVEPAEKYIAKGETHIVPKKFFKRTRGLARGVFEATPGDSSSHFGTAFHVGGDFVLTNQHVLSVSRDNSSHCSRFKIKLNPNQRNKRLYCKKVHHCNKEMDYCLIEMWKHPRGYALSNLEPPTLNLRPVYSSQTKTLAIGNTRGFGIHASMGKGLISHPKGDLFFSPIFGGNSGGPLFDEQGEVIAVVRAQSKELFSKSSYNVAIPLRDIKADLEKALGEENPALKKLNFKRTYRTFPSHNQDNPL